MYGAVQKKKEASNRFTFDIIFGSLSNHFKPILIENRDNDDWFHKALAGSLAKSIIVR